LVGLSALVAVATIYFRDLQHLVDILFQALFFATPIFYPLTVLEKSPVFHFIATLNPLLYFIAIFRDPLVQNQWPDLTSIIVATVFSFSVLFLGVSVVKKFSNRIIFKL
jgi:ABC-2 type transport system permease protein/lipopolysaccharide transport system permease protein